MRGTARALVCVHLLEKSCVNPILDALLYLQLFSPFIESDMKKAEIACGSAVLGQGTQVEEDSRSGGDNATVTLCRRMGLRFMC